MVVAGLCRLLARKGIRVAPFKAQNMSNNSAVTVEGGEIGRAQAMQARAAAWRRACGSTRYCSSPAATARRSWWSRAASTDTVAAGDYFAHRDRLAEVVNDELAGLRSEFDAVICEGAGSPAEINLRATDLANMGLARAANLPVIVVGDIDRGGLLAHLFGTVAVLDTGGPGADRGVRGQQVSRRPRAARAGPDAVGRADRQAHLRRRPVRRRLVARHRGLGFGAGAPRGRPAAAAASASSGCGSQRSGCRASPTPPTSRRWPASPACWCAG